MLYLDLDTLLAIAERATGATPLVADYGLLDSALGRPQAIAIADGSLGDLDAIAARLTTWSRPVSPPQ